MTSDLSGYELRVLRQMATGEDEGIATGAALWTALDTLRNRGLVRAVLIEGIGHYIPTEAGRALVEEANSGHR